MKVLVVDDDVRLLETLAKGLAASGIATRTAEGVDAALELLEREDGFDLILLDVMMPGRPGWELLESLRGAGDETPVLFVTARDAVEERVRGLELGADDYIIKPFALAELLARMNAVVRRRRALPTLRVGELSIDLAHHRVERAGELVELTPREFELLCALAEEPSRVHTREELLRKVWGMDFDPGSNVVDVHVGRLRRKVDRRGAPLIRTVIGEGYRLSVPEEGAA